MHARPDELLSLRDGALVDAEVRAHVTACAECTAGLARIASLRDRMLALPPAPEPPEDGWQTVQSRLAARHIHRPWSSRVAPYAAAASMAALGLFATLRWLESPEPNAAAPQPLIVLETESLDELRARSQALEVMLAALPERPAVERADTSVPIDSLQAQVQWLDHQLTLAGADGTAVEAERLWRDRVEVMNSLVQLRYVEAQHVVY